MSSTKPFSLGEVTLLKLALTTFHASPKTHSCMRRVTSSSPFSLVLLLHIRLFSWEITSTGTSLGRLLKFAPLISKSLKSFLSLSFSSTLSSYLSGTKILISPFVRYSDDKVNAFILKYREVIDNYRDHIRRTEVLWQRAYHEDQAILSGVVMWRP